MSISQASPPTLRPPDPDEGGGAILPVGPERREQAIARLLSPEAAPDPGHAARFLDYARAHAVNLDHLWAAVDRLGRLEGVALAVPNPGKTAMFFASAPQTPHEARRTGLLIDALCRQIAEHGVHLAQTLLDLHDRDGQEVFAAAGFSHLSRLSYQERSLRARLLPQQPQWPAGAQVVPYRPSLKSTMIAVLDASYQGTLDCPGLRGCRATGDVLEGHRSTGLFEADLWLLLMLEGRPAGALLLNPAADRASIELVYLGLAPWARGRGLGVQLLRHGLHTVAGRPERVMTLAVDEANAPALRLYRREHFRAVLRRNAMIRALRSECGA